MDSNSHNFSSKTKLITNYKFSFILAEKKFRKLWISFFMKFIPLPFLYIGIYLTNLYLFGKAVNEFVCYSDSAIKS